MNNWQTEKMAELHRMDLVNEGKRIHSESPARRMHVHRPSIVTRIKINLANWMIAKGKELRGHHEVRTFSHVH
ncbi:MAG TPA: hypothetical protein VJ972_06955 [Anaerolineales bacterium]|nr:hypothetical protein [Anaerolineales bacterium]